jgi:sulfoxide reductase heme-binding subunit YedZ
MLQTWWKRGFPLLLRVAVHIGSLIPLVVLAWDFQTNNLTINPIQAAEQRTGDIAMILLILSLSCTPISTLLGWSHVTQRRKALGLYSFFYASLHLVLYAAVDYGFAWQDIWTNVTGKLYLVVGTLAFLAMLPLAATSFNWFMRRMGKNWRVLHRLVYPAAVLVILHFAWAMKGDLFTLRGAVIRPFIYGLILLFLLALRIPIVRRTISTFRRNLLGGLRNNTKSRRHEVHEATN